MAEQNKPIILTFGGGLNSQRRSLDVDPQECTDGENFNLDPQVSIYRRRAPFDLVGTAPNAGAINGYAQVIKRDGTISTIIQAGTNVYEWDGTTGFTLVGTVLAGTKLRGPEHNNFPLNDYVIVTDLNKLTVVQTWDGTSFAPLVHNLSQPLYAKHCHVHDERAFFGNVKSGSDTPSILLASKIGDPTNLTTSGRPSSALADNDPFFLQTLDLRPINGLEQAWRTFFISTDNGHMHALTGSTSKDFNLESLWEGSEAAGEEAIANMGNDVAVAVQGRIESLKGTLNFGDVVTNNLAIYFTTQIKEFNDWTVAYNRRLRKCYFFPTDQGVCYVLHKDLLDLNLGGQSQISPWSKWTTDHTFNFNPTCVMPIRDPVSGLDQVYLGDSSGNVFLLEGRGGKDAGNSTHKSTSATTLAGTSGYVHRNAALTGAANSAIGILSFWVNPTNDPGGVHYILDETSANAPLQIIHNGNAQSIVLTITDGVRSLSIVTANNSVPFGTWTHFLASWNVAAPAGSRTLNICINGTVVSYTINVDTGVGNMLPNYAAQTDWFVGVNQSISTTFDFLGCITEFYFAPGQYLDVTNATNIQKFISPTGIPIKLGNDGSIPTGTAPIMYLTDGATLFPSNRGTGGDFVTVGALTDCTSAPGYDAVDVTVFRTSGAFRLPMAEMFDFDGYVLYEKIADVTITLTFLWGGTSIDDQSITISLPGATGGAFYNGPYYYNDAAYYNSSFSGRLSLQDFSRAGLSSLLQVKATVTGAADFSIHEIGLRFRAASR